MPEYAYQGKNTRTFQKLPGFKKLVAWQAASDLGYLVSKLTRRFGPSHFRLADQLRGAAISVSGNLAEGYSSGSLANYIRYCHHARGSLAEMGSYLQDCERDGLLTGDELANLLKQYSLTTLLLDRLLQALMEKQRSGTWDNSFGVKESPADYVADDFDPSTGLHSTGKADSPPQPLDLDQS